ncbi:hypothetical protein [Pseudoclavibacter sp. AY1F1]|uniref:hypothetical protein n=1 Tax=Pseudoclavibacter sp. AY1F1 TaxID=2080583 RepID=UPI0015E3C461|nr:hypothetical protein [Pseudoclavibacter sp. AY1F1]
MSRLPRPLDKFMANFHEAADGTLLVDWNEQPRFKQLAGLAKRHGRIPDGWEITFARHEEGKSVRLAVRLGPLPEWQTRVLDAIPVPARLTDPNDVTQALSASDTFTIQGNTARHRALRLMQALVEAARSEGFSARAVIGKKLNWSGDVRRDEVEFATGAHRFQLWFRQPIDKVPHEPSERETTRAKRGYLFPDFDEVPSENLTLKLEGQGEQFWASSWSDAAPEEEGPRLEDHLAQVLEEMKLRCNQLTAAQEEADRVHDEKERQRRHDEVLARASFRAAFLTEAMQEQAEHWQEARRLRAYASAIRKNVETDRSRGEAALEWAREIEQEADRIDPLIQGAQAPRIPEPSYTQLQEHTPRPQW